MTAFPVRIGIDDLSTGSQACSGYSFFCLPEAHVEEYVTDARAILDSTTMKVFHAKDYKRRFRDAYSAFVRLIVQHVRKSPQAFVACRLFSLSVKRELASFCNRFVKDSVNHTIGPKHPSVSLLQPYFYPLGCLAALARELAPNVVMRIEMDSHASLHELNTVVHEALGAKIEAADLLKDLYNGYAHELHERTPVLPNNGLTVLDDDASMMVQAADVIGNFAMAHMSVMLGHTGKASKAKSEIFSDAIGESVSAFDPSGKLHLNDNVLELIHNGGITFKMAWSIGKPPNNPSLMEDWPKDDGFLGRN